MPSYMLTSTFTALALLSLNGCATEAKISPSKLDDKVPYPQADNGYRRYVLQLPALKDENATKLELQIGKTLKVDCNHHHFGANLIEHTVQGWGYPYYKVDRIAGPASTLMACPAGTDQTRFVAANGDGFLLRYNSKLPVVVYLPDDVELRYRTWQATPEFKIATPEQSSH